MKIIINIVDCHMRSIDCQMIELGGGDEARATFIHIAHAHRLRPRGGRRRIYTNEPHRLLYNKTLKLYSYNFLVKVLLK